MHLRLAFAVALAACKGPDDTDVPLDTDTDTDVGDTDNDTDVPPDTDIVAACTVDEPGLREELDAACVDATPVDASTVDIEWNWVDPVHPVDIESSPAVGDLDGDGVPSIVFDGGYDDATLTWLTTSLDGGTGAIQWQVSGGKSCDAPALADLDGDGDVDVVRVGYTGVEALDGPTGASLWVSPLRLWAVCSHPIVADIDGNGTIEVLVQGAILDGATGTVTTTLRSRNSWNDGQGAFAMDLDGDGDVEIGMGNGLYDATGARLWTCGPDAQGTYSQPADLDGDGVGEVIISGNGELSVCDLAGVETLSLPRLTANALCLADFDGDGDQEMVAPDSGKLSVYEGDGTRLWTRPNHTGGSAYPGCTLWDLDVDGVPEVLFFEPDDGMYAFDGMTGAVELHVPWTGGSYYQPFDALIVAADVDADGRGEILLPARARTDGLVVYGGPAFAAAPAVWNQFGYYDGDVNADFTLPAFPATPWASDVPFRGQTSWVPSIPLANLHAEITDTCADACEADAHAAVAARVWNDGTRDVAAGTTLELFGAAEAPLRVETLPTVPAGGSVSLVFDVTYGDAADGLRVAVDGEALAPECDEGDNEATVAAPECP